MNLFVQHYQPELFPLWKQDLDLKPHPCASQDQKMEFMKNATFELGNRCLELQRKLDDQVNMNNELKRTNEGTPESSQNMRKVQKISSKTTISKPQEIELGDDFETK